MSDQLDLEALEQDLITARDEHDGAQCPVCAAILRLRESIPAAIAELQEARQRSETAESVVCSRCHKVPPVHCAVCSGDAERGEIARLSERLREVEQELTKIQQLARMLRLEDLLDGNTDPNSPHQEVIRAYECAAHMRRECLKAEKQRDKWLSAFNRSEQFQSGRDQIAQNIDAARAIRQLKDRIAALDADRERVFRAGYRAGYRPDRWGTSDEAWAAFTEQEQG